MGSKMAKENIRKKGGKYLENRVALTSESARHEILPQPPTPPGCASPSGQSPGHGGQPGLRRGGRKSERRGSRPSGWVEGPGGWVRAEGVKIGVLLRRLWCGFGRMLR